MTCADPALRPPQGGNNKARAKAWKQDRAVWQSAGPLPRGAEGVRELNRAGEARCQRYFASATSTGLSR
jgi:hypothetical protein